MKTDTQQAKDWQERINAISHERNQLKAAINDAKKTLMHLVDHWDEYSQSRLRNELTVLACEVL